ncbi:hypothetical protein P692DRAFT_201808407 [Suillus brevipes Sb2]|nr:hypothetical protein P692DRAFT_201808407 [Suillus brevipes Sb2]
MNRLLSDPHVNVCPDFMLAFYQTSCMPLVTLNNTEEQAVELLQAVWVATNAAQHVQWQDQVAVDQVEAAEKQCLLDEENDHKLQAQCLAEATIDDEEKKRTDSNIFPFLNALVLLLEKGHYIEIYYWTNKGIADACLVYRATDAEGMVPYKTVDGFTTLISASTMRPSTTVVPDSNLDALEFAQAIPRLVASLTERGWGHDRVHMLAGFWGALMLHRYWISDNPLDKRALLMYQEEQRRAWHQAIPLPGGAWDISILDDAEITCTLDHLYREDRRRKDHDFDYQTLSLTWTFYTTSVLS